MLPMATPATARCDRSARDAMRRYGLRLSLERDMMRRGVCVSILLVAILSACVQEGAKANATSRLNDAEITRQIRGRVLSYSEGRTGLDANTTEVFYCSGSWLAEGGRPRRG